MGFGPFEYATVCNSSSGTGTADCDGDPTNGCEAKLSSDENCGACGNACVPGPNMEDAICLSSGFCTDGYCKSGFRDEDGDEKNGCEFVNPVLTSGADTCPDWQDYFGGLKYCSEVGTSCVYSNSECTEKWTCLEGYHKLSPATGYQLIEGNCVYR